jgi:hypothetical protein
MAALGTGVHVKASASLLMKLVMKLATHLHATRPLSTEKGLALYEIPAVAGGICVQIHLLVCQFAEKPQLGPRAAEASS